MTSENSSATKPVDRLRDARPLLLKLHKILMDYQRQIWERKGGTVNNSYEFLNVVMHDPEFAWLRRLSELIVLIDEMFDADEENTEAEAAGLLEQTRSLLSPSERGGDFQRNYFEALQNSPDVVLEHSEIVRVIGKRVPDVH